MEGGGGSLKICHELEDSIIFNVLFADGDLQNWYFLGDVINL